jgi:hypothetical protein
MNFTITGSLNTDILHSQLKALLGGKFYGLSQSNNTISLNTDILTEQEQDGAAAVINAHFSTAHTTFDFIFEASKQTQQANISFGQNLLHDWMRKNVLEGMSIKQSLWVFARFEDFKINCDFGEKHVDLFKMFQSGAIPTVYFCILQIQPDDMTQPYHWLTQERLDWVKEKIELHIGQGMASYVQSLVGA